MNANGTAGTMGRNRWRVGAKYNIPYYTAATATGRLFDRSIAEQFKAGNCLTVEDGEEIQIE